MSGGAEGSSVRARLLRLAYPSLRQSSAPSPCLHRLRLALPLFLLLCASNRLLPPEFLNGFNPLLFL